MRRTQWCLVSATRMPPCASTATPEGDPKLAAAASPSAAPLAPLPASVLTTPADVISVPRRLLRLLYDVLLGFCGTALTLSAASAFSRGNVVNRASGALEKEATVTASEMLEHAFYQVLNSLQAGFLHCLPAVRGTPRRAALCLLVTGTPWLVRHRFPVNSFSKNYANSPWTLVNLLYRAKKYQYVAYKHALLFGLNATLALSSARDCLPQTSRTFRLYWVLLNAAYVLECARRPASIDGR